MPARAIRFTISLTALGIIGVSVAALVFLVAFSDHAERYLSGVQPYQFLGKLDADLLDDYGQVFGVAHNSGDSVDATRKAHRNGADVIEIDVISIGSALYAGHDRPLPFVGSHVFRGPRLEVVWAVARDAEVIKLDLKETSPAYVDRVIRFLEAQDEHPVIVSSRSVDVLARFEAGYPRAVRLLSVKAHLALALLQDDERALAVIDGVTVRHTLLDEASAGWLKERGYLILAWTVNDLGRVNELVQLGVDAITTENLAILRLLGDNRTGELELVPPRRALPPPEPRE
ncbi:MAG: hypothetical protein Kow0010_18540 [Dehalococcoidia bacterium]